MHLLTSLWGEGISLAALSGGLDGAAEALDKVPDLFLGLPMGRFLWAMTKILLVFLPVSGAVAYVVWLERRLLSWFQSRLGPNRVGPFGLLQPIADGIKLFLKEDIVPLKAGRGFTRFLFKVAPVFAVVPAFAGLAVVAFAPYGADYDRFLMVTNIDIGVLFVFALGSLGVFGIVLAGWTSGSKYPVLASLRSANQMISYEIPLTLSVLGVLMSAESLQLGDIVLKQQGTLLGFLPAWNIFPQIVGFGVFVVAAIAETNRLPFDMAEAESELTGGFHTEYSGMRFAFFFMAEYASIMLLSFVGASMFLGGWDIPFINEAQMVANGTIHPLVASAMGVGTLCIKVFFILVFFIWIRTTIPRYRYDQLMKIGWKILLPLALANLFLTTIFKAFTF